MIPMNTHFLESLPTSSLTPSPSLFPHNNKKGSLVHPLPQILQWLPSHSDQTPKSTNANKVPAWYKICAPLYPTYLISYSPSCICTHCSHSAYFAFLEHSLFASASGPLRLLLIQVECLSIDISRAGFLSSSWSLFKCHLT